MKIGTDIQEYPIVMVNVSTYSSLTAIYKRDDGSAGYISVALCDYINSIKFTTDNTAKLVFKKEKHMLSDPTWPLAEIYIPENVMFNNKKEGEINGMERRI
jgi:hypothetical protein